MYIIYVYYKYITITYKVTNSKLVPHIILYIYRVIAHHFCSHVSEEMHQCVIYDSNKPDAKLIGIEYLVSERIFNTLDSDEKRYWHSHKFEVGSGMLTAPDLSTTEENKVVEQIANMYGKIIHTWAIDENPQLPIGM